MPQGVPPEYHQVVRLSRTGEWQAAETACRDMLARHPAFAPGWLAASRIALALKSATGALDCVDRALALRPLHPQFLIHRAHCLIPLGRLDEAVAVAAMAEREAAGDACVRDAAGTVYSYANQHERALQAYDQAVKLAPQNPRFFFNRAAVRRYAGNLSGAETDYDRVVSLQSTEYEAYKNRSDLRPQTEQRNHIAALEALAAQPFADWRGEVQIRYALAKEYEDLARYPQSMAQLSRGAKIFREHLQYDVTKDVATVQWIIEAFPRVELGVASGDAAPIFVIGLPRSGTTLVERILASHSALFSAGELDSFAVSLTEAVQLRVGKKAVPREQMVAESARLDFAALGQDYVARARAASGRVGRFVDKMPLNYLYCGLIKRALPNARIVHVMRHPLASCYAMYKTLFRDGYPFSYDFGDIARYYAAYRRLMAHWETLMPRDIHTIHYEALVRDHSSESRRLLAFCGLEWEEACANFHVNPSASMTASAAQVRRPLYDSSVAQWRHYESELEPLKRQLEAAGVAV